MPLRFPFVFSWPHSSFLFSPETYYIVWRYLSLFIRSPPKEHLGCFQFVVTMNKAAMNTCEQVLCAYNISVHVGKYPGVPVLGHLVRGHLVAKKPPTVLPGGGGEAPCCILTAVRVPLAPCLCQHLVLSVFGILAVLVGV